MKLRDWLQSNRITYEAFAAKIGADKSQVWRWANDERVPTLPQAAEIRAATDGAVTLEDWV